MQYVLLQYLSVLCFNNRNPLNIHGLDDFFLLSGCRFDRLADFLKKNFEKSARKIPF